MSRPAEPSAHLQKVGLLPLVFLFYAYTTAGPFGYEEAFSRCGPGAALLFMVIVPFLWSIPMSLAAAEMNSLMPVEGGFYRWVRAAFGDFWGFQAGWWNWTGTFLLNSSYGVLFVDYLKGYLPSLSGFERWLVAASFLCLLAYANVRGIRIAGWLAVALQVGVLIPVAWLCVAALFQWQHNPLAPVVPPDRPWVSVFGAGLALIMWNYAGYEQLTSVAEEVREPERNYVRALAWTTPLAVLTYTLPMVLALAALGNWSEWKTGYIVTAAAAVGGPALGVAMLAASIIAVAALSNSTILSTTRMPFALAQDGYLPRWLAAVHPRYGTPARAIVFSTIGYCLLALLLPNVVELVAIYLWLRIATSLLTLYSAWRLRRTLPEARRSFRIPGGTLGLVYVVALPTLLCAVGIYYSDAVAWKYSPWMLLAGPLAYLVLRRRSATQLKA
ncbi:MAG TPA: APC family permease [Candidatus Xenobia bacterium]|nr:APC family permease [Candidatus Xenobia bacterium]